MEIKINFPKDNVHIDNLAFIKALLIKTTIERLDISYKEKENIRKEVMEYLKKTWKLNSRRVRITQKRGLLIMKEKIRIIIYSRKSKYTDKGDSCRKSDWTCNGVYKKSLSW